jgi:hypothetical protein
MLGPRLYLAEVYGRMTSLTGVMPLDWSRETLVLYRMRPIIRVQIGSGRRAGARPMQLFEGSRRWGGIYAN